VSLSRRKPFNTTINIYAQASPGIPGLLLDTADAHFLSAAHLVDITPFGTALQAYVTTESAFAAGPSYTIVQDTFSQTVDYSPAVLLEDNSFLGPLWVCHHLEQMVFPAGEQYWRLHIADADALASIPYGGMCITGINVPLNRVYHVKPFSDPAQRWFNVPAGATDCIVSNVVVAGTGALWVFGYAGDCSGLILMYSFGFTPGDPPYSFPMLFLGNQTTILHFSANFSMPGFTMSFDIEFV